MSRELSSHFTSQWPWPLTWNLLLKLLLSMFPLNQKFLMLFSFEKIGGMGQRDKRMRCNT